MKLIKVFMMSLFFLAVNIVSVNAWTEEGAPENIFEAAYSGDVAFLKARFRNDLRYAHDIEGCAGRTLLELACMGGNSAVLNFLAKFYTQPEIKAALACCFCYYQNTVYPPGQTGYDNSFAEGNEAI
jgi:hypothetical protein